MTEVATGDRGPLGLELRDRRGDDRGVYVLEGVAAQAEQIAQRGAQLVGRGLADRRKAPVLDQLLAAKCAEVGLRVPDVDREEHGRSLCSAVP